MIDHHLFAVFLDLILVEEVEETDVLFGIVDGDEGSELTVVFPFVVDSVTELLLLTSEDIGLFDYDKLRLDDMMGCWKETLELS